MPSSSQVAEYLKVERQLLKGRLHACNSAGRGINLAFKVTNDSALSLRPGKDRVGVLVEVGPILKYNTRCSYQVRSAACMTERLDFGIKEQHKRKATVEQNGEGH